MTTREPEFDPDVLEAVARAIYRVPKVAAPKAALNAVAALLRTQASEWKSSDLMDAAAWLDGTL